MKLTSPDASLEILLLAGRQARHTVGEALSADLDAHMHFPADLRECHALLQGRSYSVLLLEESVALENMAAVESLYEVAGTTLILEVNFGTSTADRVVRQLKSALSRRSVQEKAVRVAVMHALQSQLSASVTGLLLESQMALRTAGPQFAPSAQHLVSLAEALCTQLRI